MKFIVILTQYKRNYLETQLEYISKQTLKPDYLVVFQNENHVNIDHLKDKYDFLHVKSDYNTKYFGRFSYCFPFPVDLCIVMDDDIIPGINCFKNYTDECLRLDSIIGGNGRNCFNNPYKNTLKQPLDIGIRNESILVDFVGHLWCFKKEWLHYMFSIKPYTYDTGEDMHLCFSSKVLGNIDSYCCKQINNNDLCDISMNRFADDIHASYRTTTPELRQNVEKYFVENYKLKLIEKN